MPHGHRQQRVAELLKREIGELLRRTFAIDEVGLLSVNEVRVAGDFKSAVVFVGVVGGTEQKKKAATRLESETKRLQTMVGQSVQLRHTPHLKFVIDDSIERGNRVLEILDQIEKGSAGPAQ